MKNIYLFIRQYLKRTSIYYLYIISCLIALSGVEEGIAGCSGSDQPAVPPPDTVLKHIAPPSALSGIDPEEKAKRDTAAAADLQKFKEDYVIDPFNGKSCEEVYTIYKDAFERRYVLEKISEEDYKNITMIHERKNGKESWRPSGILEKICKCDSIWQKKFREVDKLMLTDN